eukprot:GHVU01195081.1.p1 GENE.GHVU01195081.1~~GHVU01195081.1.p1  ORF type:complete len:267 (-),score=18.81 GHVU01195081.1:651-1451(-)
MRANAMARDEGGHIQGADRWYTLGSSGIAQIGLGCPPWLLMKIWRLLCFPVAAFKGPQLLICAQLLFALLPNETRLRRFGCLAQTTAAAATTTTRTPSESIWWTALYIGLGATLAALVGAGIWCLYTKYFDGNARGREEKRLAVQPEREFCYADYENETDPKKKQKIKEILTAYIDEDEPEFYRERRHVYRSMGTVRRLEMENEAHRAGNEYAYYHQSHSNQMYYYNHHYPYAPTSVAIHEGTLSGAGATGETGAELDDYTRSHSR